MERELIIPLRIDRTQSTQDLAAHEADARQSLDRVTSYEKSEFDKRLAAAKVVDAKRKADKAKTAEEIKGIEDSYLMKEYDGRVRHEQRKEQLAEQDKERTKRKLEAQQSLEDRYFMDDYQRRVRAEQVKQDHAKREQIRLEEFAKANTLGARASRALESGVQSVAGQMLGLQAGERIVMGVVDTFKQAYERSQMLAKQILDTRENLRALASVAGVKADTNFAVQTALFGAKTGLGAEKARSFQESFLGRAQMVKGKTLGDEEFETFKEYAGTITAAKNIPAEMAGELLGGVAKGEDFKGKGQGGKEAAARSLQMFSILDAGSGRMPVLAPQMQKLMALVSENKLESSLNNAGEAAAIISTMAERDPGEAAVYAERSISGMRDFGNKDKEEFFKRSGIGATTGAIESFEKTFAVLDAEVAKGVPVDAALDTLGFKEEREKKGLMTAYNARDKVFRPQVKAAQGAPDLSAVDKLTEEYYADSATVRAQGRGLVEARQAVAGAQGQSFEAYKEVARSELEKEGAFGVSRERVAAETETFGGAFMDTKELMVEKRAKQDLGLDKEKGFMDSLFRGLFSFGNVSASLSGATAKEAEAKLTGQQVVEPGLVKALDDLTETIKRRAIVGAPPALQSLPPALSR